MPVDLESLRSYCLKKAGKITEEFPFDEFALVFKVNGKMFIIVGTNEHPITINLKCDPERAVELRERYNAVLPGYHMNKKHWNTVILDGSLSSREVFGMIDHSYDLVAKSAPARRTKRPQKKRIR
ncbi:MAG TPA: MmcQ/YjbR family DNA-binding protein [Bacteroidota bacterium]|nr:MmcQ/YjbR family DNA-binding protein [Bacteroidota bacterium]